MPSPRMTRKHYIEAAKFLSESSIPSGKKKEIQSFLVKMFAEDNGRFDVIRFAEKCKKPAKNSK
jgi:hypothetical protein